MGIAADIVTSFVEPLDKFISSGVTNLASEINGPLTVCASLYMVIFGILILLGYIRSPTQDFVLNCLKLFFILAVATQVKNYDYYVKDFFFTKLPDGIISALGKIPGVKIAPQDISSGSAFDGIIDQAMLIGTTIAKEGGWTNFYPVLVSILLCLIALAVSLLLLAIVLFAKTALALILSIGPLFIAMLVFRVTQPFFSSWISAVVNFILLQVLVMTTITLLASIIDNYLTQAAGKNVAIQMVLAWRAMGLFAFSTYLALQLPEIAARISSGGLALGGGIANSAVKALSKAVLSAPAFKPGSGSGGTISKG